MSCVPTPHGRWRSLDGSQGSASRSLSVPWSTRTWRGRNSLPPRPDLGQPPDWERPALVDLKGKRVWVAGHHGLVGSALVHRLETEPIGTLVTASSAEVDLRRQADTEGFV